MKNLYFFLIAFFIISVSGHAQNTDGIDKSSVDYVKSYTSKMDGNWLWIKKDSTITPDEYFSKFKKALSLSSLDSMQLMKVASDGFDFLIYRYQQYHKGIPIENAEYILEVRKGKVEVAHGHLAKNVNLPVLYLVDEATALSKAKISSGFSKFSWEIDSLTRISKQLNTTDKSIYLPKANIVFADLNAEGVERKTYRLSYKFEITGTGKEYIPVYDMYVDASNGNIIEKRSKTKECFLPSSTYQSPLAKVKENDLSTTKVLKALVDGGGTAVPLFSPRYGNTISFTNDVLFTNNGIRQELKQTQRGLLQTRYWNTPNDPIYNFNGNGEWGTNHQDATTVHWAVERSYEYFNPLRPGGMSGQNNSITAYAKWPANNAQYYNSGGLDYIRCGVTPGGTDIISLDIIGHEYTHGVTRYTAGLLYQGLSGALNESFSDMLGTMIEYSVFGNNGFNYLIGEDVFAGGLRDMQNPNNHNQPGVVNGTFWSDPNGCTPNCDPNSPGYNDCCFVHTNSGVPNRWFFIVATRPDGSPQIGNAGFVALGTLGRLTSSSDFNDARNASIVVSDYYFGGACNAFSRDVTNAWATVGVGLGSTCQGRIAANEDKEYFSNNGYPIAYPNPVSDVLKVELKGRTDIVDENVFSLYSIEGKKVEENTSRGNYGELNVASLPTGIYILHVTSMGKAGVSTIMKQQVIVRH